MTTPELSKEQEKQLSTGKTANPNPKDKEKSQSKTSEKKPEDPWNLPEGNKTEVLDDEGHRNTLNKH